jgi:hypothetical protein
MPTDKLPRRKVVRSNQTVRHWSNLFECTLSCGHIATASGRVSERGKVPAAPKTAGCRKCAALAQAGHTGDVR